MSRRIAIVGGGYIGALLARSLESRAEVTLIEQRSHFVHTPAMIRAVVSPSILDRALIPYDGLLAHGKLIHARATGVSTEGVTLEDGSHVAADFIVVSTGSDYATPFKAEGTDVHGLRAANAETHARLNAAGTVAIVGAGPVGIELAGEIAHAMPGKTITLISDQPMLLPEHPVTLGRSIGAKLRTAGVEVIFGAAVENLVSTTAPYSGAVRLSNGREIVADLVFPVIGSRAVSDLLQRLPDAATSDSGRIKVDPFMRPSSLPNIFAAGDVADAGDAMTIVAASRQQPWLTKSLRQLADGRTIEELQPYKPWKKAPILLPLGPEKGASFLGLFTAGNFATRQLKGKDLFLTKYNGIFGRTK